MEVSREAFDVALDRAAQKLLNFDRKKEIKLVSNLDADGITAASIMSKTLQRLGFSFSISILHQLKSEIAKDLSEESFDNYIFCDLGSGQIKVLNEFFEGKSIIILDHHEIQGEPNRNIEHINPHLFGFNGSDEISAAGVCFLFSKAVDKKNIDLAHLAIIGAIGDVQEHNGFSGLNKEILKIAIENNLIEVNKGPRLYGLQTRPLVKLLEYGSDLEIPGVTGDRNGAKDFLRSIDFIETNTFWKTYEDLELDDRKRFVDKIIFQRKVYDIPNAEDVLTNVYTLVGEKGVFSDAKELSTLLNSCGRMDNAEVGIGVCLCDEAKRQEALYVLKDYKKAIVSSINWFNREYEKEDSDFVFKGENFVIINAKDKIKATIIGTLASIISKGNTLEDDTFVLSMAHLDNSTSKISLRISNNPDDVDLRKIISNIVEITGGEAGGHQFAAGAVITTDKEDLFLEEAKKQFSK